MINKKITNSKVIIILGPTSSGKTKLAVRLAALFNGEIVSADSRQVYKGMDVGTGKDLGEYTVPYHLIDVADPKKQFDVAKYQKLAYQAIDNILKRGKLPIVAGGSGLYLQAVVDGYKLNKVKADKALRRELEKLTIEQLLNKLKALNPAFASKLNQSDSKNKRRLIRYVEIMSNNVIARSAVPTRHCGLDPQSRSLSIAANSGFRLGGRNDVKIIGLTCPREVLNERIRQRLIDRLEKEDMIGEVKRLHREGLSWKRLESFGLEYKFIARYLQGKMKYEEMVEKLNIASRQFARKQMTWFRRWERQGREIEWMDDGEKAVGAVSKFLE
ncbi:MAG: tRNA (adenosine(37)-N6)-dimethylallyltransferase MiaA [bacterium]|nr:tRNA (adenosine(37)-N6)-dimethylallyltransferase MiaA [bacterium]